MPTLSPPMKQALQKIIQQCDASIEGRIKRVYFATPGTLRALERRGLIKCDACYATDFVEPTNVGRTELAKST